MVQIATLSKTQVEAFNTDGYLVVPGAFSDADTRSIGTWAGEIAALPEESGKQWVYHEESLTEPGRELISRIENISPFHEGFRALSEALRAPVGQLLGETALLFKEKVNYKMPGGDGFKPHQDSQAGWDAYADFYITVMLCIDEASEENGCLFIAPGHHQGGLFRAWEPLTDDDMADMDFVPCPTKPGDLVFFDCYAPHGSEPNLSDKIRRMYFATYNRASAGDHLARYYADKHKSYPPDIDRVAGKEYVFRV